jgi:hypothetical protein
MLTTAAIAAIGAGGSLALGGEDTPRSSEDGPDAKPLTLRERRFRWVFLRALKRQRAKGKIDAKTYRRFKIAVWSGLPIAGGEGVERGPFVRHLHREISKAQVANGIFDIFDGFDWSFDGMLQWLLENWQIVARIVLMLLVFLEQSESE